MELAQAVTMFFSAFLAATVVPFSSDLVFFGLLQSSSAWGMLLFAASVGNTLGGLTTYLLGKAGRWVHIEKYLGIKPHQTLKAHRWVERQGVYAALLCWLPLIGDVIALMLGFAKTPIFKTTLLMGIGKTLRYLFIVYLFSQGQWAM